VNDVSRSWRRPVLRVLVLALAVAVAPLPVWAGEPPSPSPVLKASILKAVAAESLVAAKAPVARAAQSAAGSSSTDLSSRAFFKSKAGIITLLFVGTGVGFALYSTSHDRVKSPNQKYGG
jgi:hypothetical protein